MSVFDQGLPSVRQIQSFIKNKQKVEIALINNITLKGVILWLDPNCLCVVNEDDDNKILLWFHAIAYLKPLISN